MHGADLSFTRREVALCLNFVIGWVACGSAFLFIHLQDTKTPPPVLAIAAVAAAMYLTAWQCLYPRVEQVELASEDAELYGRGIAGFLYGVLSVALVSLLVRSF